MDEITTRLAQLDACAVSDALDKLGLPGAVTGLQRLSSTRRISGRVLTVKMERAEGHPPAARHLATTAVEAAQPGDVIVMEQRTGLATARTARGRIVETGTNVPITVGDVTVTPGDFVVADGSAVVFIARNDIDRVLEAAEAVAARERAMVAALREGTPISEVMGRNYE